MSRHAATPAPAGDLTLTTGGATLAWPLQAAEVRAREKRNAYAIHGYTGSNGGGKTACAVYDSLPLLAAGRPIVSTCRILDPRTGQPHPLWVPLDDYRLLLTVSKCVVLLDEVTGIANSRDAMSLPSAVQNHLNQMRKDDVLIKWTTPNWKRADTIIREVTQGLTSCRGLLPETSREVDEDGIARIWRPRRGFSWRTFDAQEFDEWSTAKEKSKRSDVRLRPKARQIVWARSMPGGVGPLNALDFYDTYEHALALGVVSEHGTCMDCGGNRPRKKCACTPEGVSYDPSPGMLRWHDVDAARRGRAALQRIEIPETDDTPGVVVETAPAL